MSKNANSLMKTKNLVQLGILSAIIIVMSFTPLGFLKIGLIEATLIPIPVAIGAILLGKKGGAILGGVFGLMSFSLCFGISWFGTQLMSINPFYNAILCFVPRILAGFLAGLIFEYLGKKDKTKIISYALSSFSVAFINTLIFVPMFVLMYRNTDFFNKELNADGLGMMAFMIAFVGINGLVEWSASLVAGGAISKSLHTILKKFR